MIPGSPPASSTRAAAQTARLSFRSARRAGWLLGTLCSNIRFDQIYKHATIFLYGHLRGKDGKIQDRVTASRDTCDKGTVLIFHSSTDARTTTISRSKNVNHLSRARDPTKRPTKPYPYTPRRTYSATGFSAARDGLDRLSSRLSTASGNSFVEISSWASSPHRRRSIASSE
jgi:hypothetical protein